MSGLEALKIGLYALLRGKNSVVNRRGAEMGHYILEFVVVCVAAFLGSYLREKGKNQATKEDIGELTQNVKDVETKYAKEMEALLQQNRLILAQGEWKHQLRLAALERRLDVHQQAYGWLVTLSGILPLNAGDHQKLLNDCRDWWNASNLFLAPNSRDGFSKALEEAQKILDLKIMGSMFQEGTQEDRNRRQDIMNGLRVISGTISVIVEDMQLPSVTMDFLPDVKK